MSDPVRDLKKELLAAAGRRHGLRPAREDRGRLRAHPRSRRALLVTTAVPLAVAITLVVAAPWKSAPGFLERADAALAPEGSILHYRWELDVPDDSGCTPGSPHEIWIDQRPPHAYRAVLTDCGGREIEIGGVLGTKEILVFVPPNRLDVPDLVFDRPHDPVAALRTAIRKGRAHDEGTTQLAGRTVERIRLGCPPSMPLCRPSYVYVDPETFFPVRDEIADGFRSWTGERFDVVTRYPTFEYLPPTAANLALTDLRAQHPDASGP